MPGYTNQVPPGCAREVVFAIDVLDVDHKLLSEQIPLSQKLSQCGFGKQKCAYLESWVNKRRDAAGKEPLDDGTVKPATTIQGIIDHVCG